MAVTHALNRRRREGSLLLGFPIGEGPSRVDSNPTRVISSDASFTYARKKYFFPFFLSLSLYFFFFFSSQPLPSRTISPFGLEDQRQRGGGGGEERSKFVTWMIQKKHALRKKEVEIDNYREFLIRVSGFRTSSMIYRRCARSCVRVVSNVYRSCR